MENLSASSESIMADQTTLSDYKARGYRGFVFAVHHEHGMILLHCTRKAKKGPHFQLPGGHIDDFEFDAAAKKIGSEGTVQEVLLHASKMGAARELYEETGIDIRYQLDRLQPARLKSKDDNGNKALTCELKRRLYFYLNVINEDFPCESTGGEQTKFTKEYHVITPMGENSPQLKLKISEEHSGFIFEPEPKEAAQKIAKHSGGIGSKALLMAMSLEANNSNEK